MSISIPVPRKEFFIYGGDNSALQNAASNTVTTDDLVCSLSLQKGGSVKLIIDALSNTNNFSKIVCVDPYGDLELTLTQYGANINSQVFDFEWNPDWGNGTSMDEEIKVQFNFSDRLMENIVPLITNYATTKNMDLKFFHTSDTEFYETHENGVEYNGVMKNSYKLVYVDRDPTTNSALKAVNFFKDKVVAGGLIVFDDHTLFNFTSINDILLENNFSLVESGNWKVVYKKN